jgi:hypothetical protein
VIEREVQAERRVLREDEVCVKTARRLLVLVVVEPLALGGDGEPAVELAVRQHAANLAQSQVAGTFESRNHSIVSETRAVALAGSTRVLVAPFMPLERTPVRTAWKPSASRTSEMGARAMYRR